MVRNVGTCCSKIISVWVWVSIPVFSQQKTFGYKTHLLPDTEHFLYTDWWIGSTSTFLKMDIWPFREREEKPFLLYLFTLAASSGLVGVQRSLIVVPASSVFPLTSSFVTFCRVLFTELLGKNTGSTSSELSVSTMETGLFTGPRKPWSKLNRMQSIAAHWWIQFSTTLLSSVAHTRSLAMSVFFDSKYWIRCYWNIEFQAMKCFTHV